MEADRLENPQLQTVLSKLTSALADASSTSPPPEGRDVIRALNFLTAVLIEAAPSVQSQAELREASQLQSEWIHRYARRARTEYEETGLHTWDVLRRKESTH